MTDAQSRAVLEALPHAVSVVDAAGRLAYANAAFWRDAGVPEEALPIGSPLRDVVRLLAYRGAFGPGDPEAQAEAAMALDRSRPMRRQISHADGSRAFETSSVPLPAGGFLAISHDITTLVRAREEQAGRARLLEGTLARLNSGVARFDAAMRVDVLNAAYEALHGLPGGTLRAGMTHREVVALLEQIGEFASTEDAEAVMARLEGDRVRPARRTRERPSGQVLRFDSQPTPDGGFVIEVADITALKRAEDEANRRAALLDGVLDAMPHGVCLYTADRRVQRFNAAYARLMEGTGVAVGESIDEVVARRLAQGEYDEETARRVLARYAPGLDHWPPMRRVRPNGEVIENSMARLPDGGLVSVFTDVTALHRAEQAERQRAALLEGVVQALPHGVCVYGPDQRVAMFNEAYGRIMEGAPLAVGEHVEEIAARRVAQGEYAAEYSAGARARRLGPAAVTDEAVRRRPNGAVVAVRVAPLPDGGHISVVTDVTAVHRAEEEARARAELLDAVIEAMPDGVCVYGKDRRARITNAAYRRILGGAAVRVGESMEEVAARRVAAGELTKGMAEELLGRHGGPAEQAGRPIERVRPDGTAIVTRAGRLPDGGHIAVISDVTALKRAEEELRRRAVILEASFATMRHGIMVWGPDRRLLAANARTPDLTGLPEEWHRPGLHFDDVIDEQVARGILSRERGMIAKTVDRSRPHARSRIHPDGRVLEIFSDPTPDGGFVVTFMDITALHRAEQELRQRAAMQEAMLSNMRHGIILYGPDRRLLATNAVTAQLTDMPPGRLARGRLMDEMLDEQVARGHIPAEQGAMMKALDRSRPQRYSRHREDGRVIDTVSEPTPDGGFVITYSDVTEDRRIRAELERARAEAEAASEAKSRFLATMSHELRTPLNAVIGLSDAIALDGDARRTAEYAAMINEAGRHLLQLVDDILDVARSQTGALQAADEAVDVAAVLEEAAATTRPAAEAAGLALHTAMPAGLPPLRGDARRLRQVFDKLLSNAVKFTPAGGRVTLSAEAGPEGLVLRVADTGIGIPRAERERMFEPFTQLDSSLARRFQGSGLGLHLARTLAHALGATLTLEDPEGPGTVAVLRFPPARLMPISAETTAPA